MDKTHKEIVPGKELQKDPEDVRRCLLIHNHNKRQENSNYAERLSSFRLAKIQKFAGTLCWEAKFEYELGVRRYCRNVHFGGCLGKCLVLKRCVLKCLAVKGYDVSNLLEICRRKYTQQ